MAMAPVITRGFGSWGSAALVITRGYAIGEAVTTAQIVFAAVTHETQSMEITHETQSMEISHDS